jgi:arylsulfatase
MRTSISVSDFHFKAVFNLRGDDGQSTGGPAVDSNVGWKGAAKDVATIPQVFDLWQDPQERYDIFMNNFTEHAWTLVTFGDEIKKLMATNVKSPHGSRKAKPAQDRSPSRVTRNSSGFVTSCKRRESRSRCRRAN